MRGAEPRASGPVCRKLLTPGRGKDQTLMPRAGRQGCQLPVCLLWEWWLGRPEEGVTGLLQGRQTLFCDCPFLDLLHTPPRKSLTVQKLSPALSKEWPQATGAVHV